MVNGNGKERELGTIIEKLGNLEKGQKRIEGKIDTQNGRIRKNEIKIAFVSGGLAVLGIAIALVKFL
jgi:hypothetical protein